MLNTLRCKVSPEWFAIMHSLLYPGVLGSLIYALPDNLVSKRIELSNDQLFVAIAFLLLFTIDYAYSITDSSKAAYSRGTFIADLLIVFFLFVVGQKALGTKLFESIEPAFLMVAAKLCAVFWEQVRNQDAAAGAGKGLSYESGAEAKTDWACVVVYLVIGGISLLKPDYSKALLGVALLLDAASYEIYKRLPRDPPVATRPPSA